MGRITSWTAADIDLLPKAKAEMLAYVIDEMGKLSAKVPRMAEQQLLAGTRVHGSAALTFSGAAAAWADYFNGPLAYF